MKRAKPDQTNGSDAAVVKDKTTIYLTTKDAPTRVPISFFAGTSAQDLEAHIKKKFKVAKEHDIFLSSANDDDDEVVLSSHLPQDGEFQLQISKAESDLDKQEGGGEQVGNFKRNNASSDTRIERIGTLLPPACLTEEIPVDLASQATVLLGRRDVHNRLHGKDDRLIVIVGPCSIHDTTAARDYAKRLVNLKKELEKDLIIIMRVYFEKPRTTVGWKGLINDPDLNGTFQINKGLKVARNLLQDITNMGLPVGCEFLDTISPQFIADLVSWGAIGARTTECQLHRELASGLSMPVGFKNGTGGGVQMAVDAVVAAQCPHSFLSVSAQGLASIVQTKGNHDCHVILRGGKQGPNYEKHHVVETAAAMKRAGLKENVMVDASHGNSQKIHTNQPLVCQDIGDQIQQGDSTVVGVMIESHIKAGNQKLVEGGKLEYGKSITDACIDWSTTIEVLKGLAASVRKGRENRKPQQ